MKLVLILLSFYVVIGLTTWGLLETGIWIGENLGVNFGPRGLVRYLPTPNSVPDPVPDPTGRSEHLRKNGPIKA